MKHATDYLWFETPNRRDYVNITAEVEDFVHGSGIEHGLCLVSPMHITAAVYANDAESGLIQDIDDWLERLAPHAPTSQTFQRGPALSGTFRRLSQTGGTTPTPTSSASCRTRSSCRSRAGRWTWARGSRSSTRSSTAGGVSAWC